MFLPLIHVGSRLKALVVGGGKVASRKVKDLLDAGVSVEGISPQCVDELTELIVEKEIPWQHRGYKKGDASGFGLVVVATDNENLNCQAYEECHQLGIPVNVVDQPELCTVYFSAVVRRDPLLLSISTGGGAPFFAREVRKSLTEWADSGWAERAKWAKLFRSWVLKKEKDWDKREVLFSRFMSASDTELEGWNLENPPYQTWEEWMELISDDGK